jgi:two-component system, NtrC family, response regulator HydG
MKAMDVSAELLLETMAEGVLVLTPGGDIGLWNAAMAEITGYTAAEAIGQPVTWLRAPGCAGAERVGALLGAPSTPEQPACLNGCECRLVNREGEQIPVLMNARSLRDENGLHGVLVTVVDFRPVANLQAEVASLRNRFAGGDRFEGMVGRSRIMQEVFRNVELAASSEATVLLTGESGTGKEMAATAIHERSAQKGHPFIRVNCGALAESVLESELFGHVRGAFTGAVRDRVGRFEAADGGTLFLDEIGEVSPGMQVKLLRVLQEGEFERVGDTETRRTDVRVLAATNRDLQAMVAERAFREDLYYRLRVFPVRLPALREHPEDVPLLVEAFVENLAERTGKALTGVTAEGMAALRHYPWPGNVRELANAIEYAFVVCPEGSIQLGHLPEELRTGTTTMPLALVPASASPVPRRRRKRPNAEQLRELLTECDWNKAEVGRQMGVSRTAVWKWMKAHGIPMEPPDAAGE